MLTQLYFNVGASIFAAISALLWALSARVNFHFGYDMAAELNKATKKASRLNAWAAAFAALAVLGQTAAMFIGAYVNARF